MIISKQGSNITLAFYDLGALFNIVEIFIEFYYGMFYLQQEYWQNGLFILVEILL